MKAAFVAGALLVAASGLAADDEQPTKFKITTKRKDDAVEFRAEKDRAVFSVKSPFGISQAVIERTDDKWPEGGGAAAAPEGSGEFPVIQRQGHAGCGGVD